LSVCNIPVNKGGSPILDLLGSAIDLGKPFASGISFLAFVEAQQDLASKFRAVLQGECQGSGKNFVRTHWSTVLCLEAQTSPGAFPGEILGRMVEQGGYRTSVLPTYRASAARARGSLQRRPSALVCCKRLLAGGSGEESGLDGSAGLLSDGDE